MIQRIQSVYLLLATILAVAFLFVPLFSVKVEEAVQDFKPVEMSFDIKEEK